MTHLFHVSHLPDVRAGPVPGAAVLGGAGLGPHDLGQPLVQVEAGLPVGEVVHEDDAVHRVHEHVPRVALAVAPADVPQLDEEFLLVLSSLQILMELHLH